MADAGWHDEGAPRITLPFADGGPAVPVGPDPARDARIDAYRDRERRRAARALDRYIETMGERQSDGDGGEAAVRVAGERFVEAVGDYVLARLGERADHECRYVAGVCALCGGVHQKAHYGVVGETPDE